MQLFKKPVKSFIWKWKQAAEVPILGELEKTLNEKIASLQRLQEIRTKLEEKNNNLLDENEDLRQSSIDGLEIANVLAANSIMP